MRDTLVSNRGIAKGTPVRGPGLQQFHLPNSPTACRPAVRPGYTMARAPVFSNNQGNCIGFTKMLFQRKFMNIVMILPFILY